MPKFTKENLREKIVADLGGSRKLSDRSITEMIDTMIQFAGEEVELDAFFAQVKPAFVTANGNLINEQAVFVNRWKEEHPDHPAKPLDKPEEKTDDIKALIAEAVKPYAEALVSFQSERGIEQRFSQAAAEFTDKFKPNLEDERVKAIVSKVQKSIKPSVKADSEISDVVSRMKVEFDELTSLAGVNTPYVPAPPSGGSPTDTEGTPEFYAKQREILEKANFIPTIPGGKQ